MRKRVLYIGGFEMPDKNAAAQRVLSVSKALRENGYDIKFVGITTSNDVLGVVDDFIYEATPYPTSLKNWISYSIGKNVINYIKKEQPDFIITYNYPAIAQERIIRYARKHGIKVIGDITEWYRPTSIPKRIDTWLRMRFSNFHLDGIISISNYLSKYYENQYIIQLPPLVDKKEIKWDIAPKKKHDEKIRLVYIGTGSIKDRLDIIVRNVIKDQEHRFILDVIGITEAQFYEIYKTDIDLNTYHNIKFHGRLPHIQALEYLKNSDFQIFFRDNIRVNNAGFPTKLVESFSAGIPVITNNISNISDYIINEKNSFIIDNLDEDSIEKVLQRVARMSKDQINEMKSLIDTSAFDYHNYVEDIKKYMNGI